MRVTNAEPMRVVGQWLDHLEADEAELHIARCAVLVHWRRVDEPPGSRTFTWSELEELSRNARRERRNPFGHMTGRWASSLRTLGQDLDSRGIEPLRVRSIAGGLQMDGMRREAEVSQWYALDRLADWDHVRRTDRAIKLLRSRNQAPASWMMVASRPQRLATIAMLSTMITMAVFGLGGQSSIAMASIDQRDGRARTGLGAERAAGAASESGPGPCRSIVEVLVRPAECARVRTP